MFEHPRLSLTSLDISDRNHQRGMKTPHTDLEDAKFYPSLPNVHSMHADSCTLVASNEAEAKNGET